MPKAIPILLLFAVIQSMCMARLYVKTALGMESFHGTALAALMTEKEIVVAADSRLVRGIDMPDPKPMCKKCETQCYHGEYRAKIREVMKFSGMHLIKHGRVDMLYHYFR